MNWSIPQTAPYLVPVFAWLFAGVPTAAGLMGVRWIIKHVRFE
jgi:hypothetical protein